MGINLWVDLGGWSTQLPARGSPKAPVWMASTITSMARPTARTPIVTTSPPRASFSLGEFPETSIEDSPGGNCGDGIDNDNANGADGSDPSCLVGDFLGGSANWGGNLVPTLGNCGVDSTFYFIKNGNTLGELQSQPPGDLPLRDQHPVRTRTPTADGPDTGCTAGGQGEIGGNDFIDYNHDGGTIMHELGHNLRLGHGGGNRRQQLQPELCQRHELRPAVRHPARRRRRDPRLLAPAHQRRRLDPWQRAAGQPGRERRPNETVVLDATDNVNRFIFVDLAQRRRRSRTPSTRPNWNGDTISAGNPATTVTGVTANINDAGPAPAGGDRNPRACINALTNETLDGNDDWNSIVIPFMQYGDCSPRRSMPRRAGPRRSRTAPMTAAINTTDLGLDRG